MRRVLKCVLGLAALVCLLSIGAFAWFVLWPAKTVPPAESVDRYVWLDQGWGEGQKAELRQRYYYTPQGVSMPQGATLGAVRYDWFLHLEQPLSKARFADPEHLRRYRFIVDPEPTAANPDHLPIGFTKHFDRGIGEYVLDITCAACHTGELHYTKNGTTTAIRIDGGQAMHAMTDMQRGNFAPELLAALINTAASPWKFDRFAEKVLGEDYPQRKEQLKDALWTSVRSMLAAGQNNPLRELYPVREGFGRTDALGRIGNTVFGDHLIEGNYQPGDAPVSYPYLWNIWKFDWVQYNGSVAQPLARNIGEALGVGAVTPWLSRTGRALPASERYRSSVRIADLHRIEQTLHLLKPPAWPEEIFGPVDRVKAQRGEELFQQYCQECHGPHVASAAEQQASAPLKSSPDIAWRIEVIPLDHVGTDPNAAVRFIGRRYDLSSTGLTQTEIDGALRPLLVRELARDARLRLREVIRLREEQKLPLGDLPAVLSKYPDPDADAEASLPLESFRAIDAALAALLNPLPAISMKDNWESPPFFCDLNCHTAVLLEDVRYGAAQIDRRLAGLDIKQLSEGAALNLVGLLIKNRFYADYGIDYRTQQCLEGFGALDLPQEIAGYKPRPLEGVWATPPFLHNGSVPSLYQMLVPPHERDQKFYVGRREFDPVHVGYVTQPAEEDAGGFWLDTSIPGNRNIGHGFAADAETWQKHRQDPQAHPLPRGIIGPQLSDEARLAIVEYLKIHRDLPATPADYEPPQCQLSGQTRLSGQTL